MDDRALPHGHEEQMCETSIAPGLVCSQVDQTLDGAIACPIPP